MTAAGLGGGSSRAVTTRCICPGSRDHLVCNVSQLPRACSWLLLGSWRCRGGAQAAILSAAWMPVRVFTCTHVHAGQHRSQ
jgi:hypothetical protein